MSSRPPEIAARTRFEQLLQNGLPRRNRRFRMRRKKSRRQDTASIRAGCRFPSAGTRGPEFVRQLRPIQNAQHSPALRTFSKSP